MRGIIYEGAEHRSLSIKVRPGCSFDSVLKIFEEMRFPVSRVPDDRISFAILELVANSMRAHEERGSEDSILVRLWVDRRRLLATVSDRGGGFDPSRLPYAIDAPVETLDLMSAEFVAYRERYGNSRFGMGLVAVRKIFPIFSLKFVDGSDDELAWPSPDIEGTTILLGLPLSA